MEEQIIAALLGDAAVSAIAGDRVWPGRVPQGSPRPCVVFSVVTNVPEYADEGEVGLASSVVQIDCWADTYGQAKQLSRAVSGLFSGVWFTAGNTEFQFILQDSARELGESSTRVNNAEYLYREMLEFTVWHSPAP